MTPTSSPDMQIKGVTGRLRRGMGLRLEMLWTHSSRLQKLFLQEQPGGILVSEPLGSSAGF